MATAGHNAAVLADSTSPPANTVNGVKSFTFGPSIDLLDTTALSDGQHRKRIQGLKDVRCTFVCDWLVSTGNAGHSDLRNSLDDDADLVIDVLPDGTNGYRFQAKVESYDIASSVDGLVEITYNMVLSAGAVVNNIADVGTP